jgi:ComF family protein
VVAPPRCAICAAACGSTDTVCAHCARELGAARSGSAPLRDQTRLVWAAEYEGTPRALVSALKFQGRLALADLAAEAIAGALAAPAAAEPLGAIAARPLDAIAVASPPDVVPVPPAGLRRRWRGFDPAELVADRLAARLELPLHRCLRRVDHRRQVGKSRARRLADPPRIRVRGRVPSRALIVDDVLTTGATLAACTLALREAGSEQVLAAVYARSL